MNDLEPKGEHALDRARRDEKLVRQTMSDEHRIGVLANLVRGDLPTFKCRVRPVCFYERLLRPSGRILAFMFTARRSHTAWLLRLAAFVLFISGGALAQRYLTAPSVIRSLPLERPQKEQLSAVIFEATRKIEFAPLIMDAVPSFTEPFDVQLDGASFEPRAAVIRGVAWPEPAFDALAPPQRR